eukprot:1151909-Pelagomonas_calceolata.AAC.1
MHAFASHDVGHCFELAHTTYTCAPSGAPCAPWELAEGAEAVGEAAGPRMRASALSAAPKKLPPLPPSSSASNCPARDVGGTYSQFARELPPSQSV